MGLGTLPTRANLQVIDEAWFNLLKTALIQDFYPRNSSGVVTDAGGNFGSSGTAWADAFIQRLYLRANGHLVNIKSPATLAGDYGIILPGALPASKKILTLDAAGNIDVTYDTDNSTLEINANTLRVKDLGITIGKLSTRSLVSSSSPGAYVNNGGSGWIALNLGAGNDMGSSITPTGKPIWVGLIHDGDTLNNGVIGGARGGPIRCGFRINREVMNPSFPTDTSHVTSSVTIASWEIQTTSNENPMLIPCSSLWAFDNTYTPNTLYRYNLYTNNYNGGGQDTKVNYCRVVVYEMV